MITKNTNRMTDGAAVNVLDFGAVGDGVTDDTVAIQAAIDSITKGKVFIPEGTYVLHSSIVGKQDVYIEGAGAGTTTLKAIGNYSAVDFVGAQGAVINRGGISDLTIRGGVDTGTWANTAARGVRVRWCNRTKVENVIFYSCYYGIDTAHNFQCLFNNCSPNGAGTDQNYIGVFCEEGQAAPYNDNANMFSNCIVQGVAKYGWRLRGFAGSKFTDCEGSNGEVGWYLGDATTHTGNTEFASFMNCVADTTSSNGWRISRGGVSSAFRRVRFINCWAGNTGASGWSVSSAEDCMWSNVTSMAAGTYALYFDGCSNCTVTGGVLSEWGVNAVILTNSTTRVAVSGISGIGDNGSSTTIKELSSSDYNIITACVATGGITTVGANTITANNIT